MILQPLTLKITDLKLRPSDHFVSLDFMFLLGPQMFDYTNSVISLKETVEVR